MKNRKLTGVELGRMTPETYSSAPESGMVVVLDNIRSAHNVGSVFRSCDAFHADRLLLCGICAVPPSAEIHKTALGAENSVPWEYFRSTSECLEMLKGEGYTLLCLEQTEKSISLETFTPLPGQKYALILGNEVDGVQQDVVDASDYSLEIPQFGTKHSLNVSVAAGIALWQLHTGLTRKP